MVKAMVGGCCVCSDERGWDENPLVYCDGHGCNVAVHQGEELFCSTVTQCSSSSITHLYLISISFKLAMELFKCQKDLGFVENVNHRRG